MNGTDMNGRNVSTTLGGDHLGTTAPVFPEDLITTSEPEGRPELSPGDFLVSLKKFLMQFGDMVTLGVVMLTFVFTFIILIMACCMCCRQRRKQGKYKVQHKKSFSNGNMNNSQV